MQLLVMTEAQDNVHEDFKNFMRTRLYPNQGGVTMREARMYVMTFDAENKDLVENDLTAFLPIWASNFKFGLLQKVISFFTKRFGVKPMVSKSETMIKKQRARVFDTLGGRHMIKVIPIGYVDDKYDKEGREIV